jgi:O-antigen/teichoic acid export membrane protein
MPSRLIKAFVSILSGQVMTLILGLAITPLLIRALGSSLYGDYAFILSFIGIVTIITNAGIFDGTRKYMSENRSSNGESWKNNVFAFYFRFATVIGLFVSLCFILAAGTGFVSHFLDSSFTPYFYLLSIMILGRQIRSVVRGGLMGLNLEHRSEPLMVLNKLLFGVTGIFLAYVGYGVSGVIVGHIIGLLSMIIVGSLILTSRVDFSAALRRLPSEFPRRELGTFNLLTLVLVLFIYSLYHVDILILRPIAGSRPTGYYRAALRVAEFLWFVPTALSTLLLHSVSELWTDDRVDRISELASRLTRYNLLLTTLLILGLAALAENFLGIYFGQEFEVATRPLLILLPGTLGFALANPIMAIGQAKGELRILIAGTGVAAVLNLVLNLLLIPHYGMTGAAVATSISYGSMFVFHVYTSRQLGFNPLADLRLARVSITALVTGIVIYTLSSVLSGTLSLLIVPVVGSVIYTFTALQTGCVDADELISLINNLPSPVNVYANRVVEILS